MRLYTVLLYFLQTALHVSDDTSTIIRSTLKTVPTPPRQRMVANMVRQVPDVVIAILIVLLMMGEIIIRNMYSCLQNI